jgi:hypothetical protein
MPMPVRFIGQKPRSKLDFLFEGIAKGRQEAKDAQAMKDIFGAMSGEGQQGQFPGAQQGQQGGQPWQTPPFFPQNPDIDPQSGMPAPQRQTLPQPRVDPVSGMPIPQGPVSGDSIDTNELYDPNTGELKADAARALGVEAPDIAKANAQRKNMEETLKRIFSTPMSPQARDRALQAVEILSRLDGDPLKARDQRLREQEVQNRADAIRAEEKRIEGIREGQDSDRISKRVDTAMTILDGLPEMAELDQEDDLRIREEVASRIRAGVAPRTAVKEVMDDERKNQEQNELLEGLEGPGYFSGEIEDNKEIIQSLQNSGVSKDKIADKLLELGWPREDIQKLLKRKVKQSKAQERQPQGTQSRQAQLDALLGG